MSRLKISASATHFEKDEKPFFLLSDTNWMAFQKLSVKDFTDIARLRSEQGFNALQISMLPIAHDNSPGENDLHPFCLKDGKYDFSKINEKYFDRAEQMLCVMQSFGLIPFLHLFWVNYIPDTWAAKHSPDTVIPFEYIDGIARYIINRFKKFEPIYSVSGDTGFETGQVVKYYKKVFDVLHELDPGGITTMHLNPDADPPEELCSHPQYHFYSYQSGHNVSSEPEKGQENMLRQSRQFMSKKHKKPIMNTEPCYEGHGYGNTYGRFTAFDVRKAVWQSLLSGASAGVSYGAHGLWQMHETGEAFNNVNFSGMPYSWRDALRFDGASDSAYAKMIFEQYNMEGISPDKRYKARSDRLCMASKDGLYAAYLPYNDDFTFCMDLHDYKIITVALNSRCVLNPEIRYENGETTVLMTNKNEDILIIAERR